MLTTVSMQHFIGFLTGSNVLQRSQRFWVNFSRIRIGGIEKHRHYERVETRLLRLRHPRDAELPQFAENPCIQRSSVRHRNRPGESKRCVRVDDGGAAEDVGHEEVPVVERYLQHLQPYGDMAVICARDGLISAKRVCA